MSVVSTYNKLMKNYAPEIEKKKAANAEMVDSQKNVVKENYGAQIGEAGRQYDVLQQQNAVQKIINEREVAESMANMGLTDSGLNRTQTTAVQLSSANSSAEIARQKQSVIDGLNREMNSRLSTLDVNRISADSEIDSTYQTMAHNAAVDITNKQIESNAAVQKAQIEAQQAKNKERTAAYNELVKALIKDELTEDQKWYAFTTFAGNYGFTSDDERQHLLNISGLSSKYASVAANIGASYDNRESLNKIWQEISKSGQTFDEEVLHKTSPSYSRLDEFDIEKYIANNSGGNNFYKNVLADLREMKKAGVSNEEAYKFLHDAVGESFISTSQYMELYNKYRDDRLG